MEAPKSRPKARILNTITYLDPNGTPQQWPISVPVGGVAESLPSVGEQLTLNNQPLQVVKIVRKLLSGDTYVQQTFQVVTKKLRVKPEDMLKAKEKANG